jgi:hypothetical protein
MDSEQRATEGGNSPLSVEGMSPLDVLVKRLGTTIQAFCDDLDIDDSTYRRWRLKGIATLTHIQARKLDSLLRKAGLSIQDLPDSLMKLPPKSAQTVEV